MKKAISKSSAGFTLIEMLVAISIFTIVMLVAMGAILAIVGADKNAQALNSLIDSMNFSVESMVRDMRTGTEYTCYPSGGSPCTGVSFLSTIETTNAVPPVSEQIAYYLYSPSTGVASIEKCNQTTDPNCSSPQTLTSSDINITKLEFYLGLNTPSANQPIIRMILQGTASTGKDNTEFNLETLISQRRLNI